MRKINLLILFIIVFGTTFSQSYLGQKKQDIINNTVTNGCFKIISETSEYLKIRCEKLNFTNEYFFTAFDCVKYIGVVPSSFKNDFIKMFEKGGGWTKIDNSTYKKNLAIIKIETLAPTGTMIKITSYIDSSSESLTWTNKDKQDFMSSCSTGAKKSLPEADAKKYCDCMLSKITKLYSPKTIMNELSNDVSLKLAQDCMKSIGY